MNGEASFLTPFFLPSYIWWRNNNILKMFGWRIDVGAKTIFISDLNFFSSSSSPGMANLKFLLARDFPKPSSDVTFHATYYLPTFLSSFLVGWKRENNQKLKQMTKLNGMKTPPFTKRNVIVVFRYVKKTMLLLYFQFSLIFTK